MNVPPSKIFLKDSLEKIGREHPLASYIPSCWPSTDVLDELTKKVIKQVYLRRNNN